MFLLRPICSAKCGSVSLISQQSCSNRRRPRSTAQDIGIPGINKGNDPFTDGLPQMNFDGPITSFYVGNPFANFYELEQTFQYATNWSYIKESHTVKWGAEDPAPVHARLQRIDKSFRGSFNFSRFATASADLPGTTGIGFASFLLGQSNSYSRGTYIQLPIEFQDRYGLYVQDQWRVSSKLSLNFGMRWEYYSPTYSDDQGREANFDFATGNMVLASLGTSRGCRCYSSHLQLRAPYRNLPTHSAEDRAARWLWP